MKTILIAAGAAGLIALPLRAQTAPPADSTVQMKEFDVSAPVDHGYVATDSTLGSRINTPIADLSFPVQVVTSQLMDDFGMFELDENVSFVSSFTGLSQGGQYNLRGFNQSYQIRDGFLRLGRYGSASVDRLEVIKGPNAAVYGEASPGGLVNTVSKQPQETPAQSVEFYDGSYRTTNTKIEATGPIAPNTYYLVDLAEYQRTFDVAFAVKRNQEAFLALRHDFDKSTQLTVQYEYYHQALDAPQQILPYVFDPVAKVYTGQLAYNLANLSRTGPASHHDRGIQTETGIFEKQLTDVFSFRLGANIYFATYNDFNNGVNTQYDEVAHTIGRGTPSLNQFNEDGGSLQGDFTAHYPMLGGAVDNRDVFSVNHDDYFKWDRQLSLGSAYSVAPYFNKTITVGQPFDYGLPAFNTVEYNSLGNDYKNRGYIDGLLFRHSSALLGGKLILFASAREDYVHVNLHDLAGKIVQHTGRHYFDPSLGLNYKVVPGVALYGSYSTGFDANIQGITANATKPVNPATTAWGDDYGVKVDALDHRLVFSAGGYYIMKKNTVVTALLPDGTTVSEPEGRQLARGAEFDFHYSVTPDLMFGGGIGHVNSKITNDGDATEAVGRKPANVADNNIGIYSRYQFSGALRGLYTNVSYTYISPTHPESATTGDTITKGVYTSSNFEWAVKIPSYYYVDWAWHYRLPTQGRFSHTFNLVVKNVFNKFYVASNDMVADRRGYYFGYTLHLPASNVDSGKSFPP